MRLPNGYGSVTKLSGNRRRPYIIKKTVGYDDKGHPIYDIINYAKTREEGLQMLAAYNNNPFDVDKSKTTTKEVIDGFKKTKKYKNFAKTTKRNYETYYKKFKPIYDIPYRDIKGGDMQKFVDDEKSYSAQGSVRNIFNNFDDYAIKNEIIITPYAHTLDVDKQSIKKKAEIFTEKEIKLLWKNIDFPGVSDILIMIYSGFRVAGILEMEIKNINLKDQTFKGGVKTNAGKNRIVPIHSKILPLVKNKIKNAPGEHLLYTDKRKVHTHSSFRTVFSKVKKEFKLDHTPHETRHTFRSRLDSVGANKIAIDLMMGHKSQDVGERVYTHKTLEELKEAIELLD